MGLKQHQLMSLLVIPTPGLQRMSSRWFCLKKTKLNILDVKLLTYPERDPNPRFKSWKVRVPYACKELMENDSFYPNGWSHRKYFPKRMEQQQDRNTRIHLDPNDPVNMEIAQSAAVGNTPA